MQSSNNPVAYMYYIIDKYPVLHYFIYSLWVSNIFYKRGTDDGI